MCKQLGEDVLQRADLTAEEKQEAACNFVWRRDQEIQRPGSPQPEEPWGRFTYDPPGEANQTTFTFKGIPKNQCSFDYDCREFNDPGQVLPCTSRDAGREERHGATWADWSREECTNRAAGQDGVTGGGGCCVAGLPLREQSWLP